jgi:hypothetical protein
MMMTVNNVAGIAGVEITAGQKMLLSQRHW